MKGWSSTILILYIGGNIMNMMEYKMPVSISGVIKEMSAQEIINYLINEIQTSTTECGSVNIFPCGGENVFSQEKDVIDLITDKVIELGHFCGAFYYFDKIGVTEFCNIYADPGKTKEYNFDFIDEDEAPGMSLEDFF